MKEPVSVSIFVKPVDGPILIQWLMAIGYAVLLILGIVFLIVAIRLVLKANKALDTYIASKTNTAELSPEIRGN